MFQKKKIVTLVSLLAFVIIGVAAVTIPLRTERNLKVLPKDISDAKLDSIMKTYNVALGVECKFCHVPVKGFPDSLDYVSDKEPMKENARNMMRMTIDINKNYFYFDKNTQPEYLSVIHCKICHKGEPIPPNN